MYLILEAINYYYYYYNIEQRADSMSYIANVHAALNTAARNVNVLKNAEASVQWVVVVFTVTCPTTTAFLSPFFSFA